jgi:hypothetical protein
MSKINRIISQTGFIFLLGVFLFLQPAFGASDNTQWTILESKGEIYQQLDGNYESLGEALIENQLIRVGEEIDVKSFVENPQKVQEHWSVVKLNNQITLAVSNGTTFQLKTDEEDSSRQNLFLEGIAHLFLMPEIEDQTVSIYINETLLESQKAYLYFNGKQDSYNLVVIAGEAIVSDALTDDSDPEASSDVSDPEASADISDPEASDLDGDVPYQIILVEGSGITKHDDQIIDQTDFSFDRKLFELSTIRGYETLGDYQKVGSVTFDQDSINILRFQKSIDIFRTPTALFRGDKLITSENQTADLAFLSKDDIKVSGSSEFIIDEYHQIEDKISFNFMGKIRAKLKKRKKKGKIKFKTVTALIGVKGTDFVANASEAFSEVATVEGLVGISDPSGAGEVDVAEGMMTSVAAGELPKEPVPIPPERMKQLLLAGSVTIAALTNITNLTIMDGVSYSQPVLNFQLKPEDALFEVYLDQKLLQNFKLNQPLNDLIDGQHQLEIKSLGEPPFTKSVQFIIDTKQPLILGKQASKDTWELIEKRPVKTTWNEAIASAEITIGQTKVPGIIAEDQVNVQFTFDEVPKFFQKEAEHVASLIAIDKAGNKQELAIKLKILTLDKTKPKVLQVIPKMDLENLVLQPGQSAKIVFNEKIVKLDAKIKGEKWNLEPDPDGRSVTIKADKPITDESQPFHIQFFDQSNLFGEIFGQIKSEDKKPIEKPKKQSVRNSKVLLEKAYVNTILLKSNTVLDQTVLNNRLPFYFNDSIVAADSMEGLPESGIDYKSNNDWMKAK